MTVDMGGEPQPTCNPIVVLQLLDSGYFPLNTHTNEHSDYYIPTTPMYNNNPTHWNRGAFKILSTSENGVRAIGVLGTMVDND